MILNLDNEIWLFQVSELINIVNYDTLGEAAIHINLLESSLYDLGDF